MSDTGKILDAITTLTQKVETLQADVKTLQNGQTSLQADVKNLKEGQTTADLKMEQYHAEDKKADKEILLTLHDIAEINQKDTDTRLDRIEKHLNLPPAK
jgi:cupin superfamily acireductone dioxygenase involved in methionine salvage